MAPTTKRRRAYIGNLRPRPNLSTTIHADLFIPNCLSIKNHPNGDGIVVASPNIGGKNANHRNVATSMYALVEFADVEYAIQVLNGAVFDGRTLRVSKEKTNFGGSGGGGGFGSMGWAGNDGGGGGGGRRSNPRRGKQQHTNQKKEVRSRDDNGNGASTDNKKWDDDTAGLNMEEAIVKGVESAISSEIKDSSDEVTAAIACTAAMTLLSSMDAFGLDDTNNNQVTGSTANKNTVAIHDMSPQDFQSRCKLPMSELMSEYGEQDADWKKQQPSNKNIQQQSQEDDVAKQVKDITNDEFSSRCSMPLSNLMAEYGEQDADWKKEQHPSSATANNVGQIASHARPKSPSAPIRQDAKSNDNDNNNGMLAHYDKAFIHLELVSFGYKYGAPSHSKRGFTYAHPLPPLDIRDLDRAPGHISKFNGLQYLVRKALLNPKTDDDEKEGEKKNDDAQAQQKGLSPMRERVNEIADEIIKVLVESIDEGGHGAISPLTMTISIGSEYGRHRGVVLIEHLAIVLRARLRRNDGARFNDTGDAAVARTLGNNGIVKQPVSVGTRHRDVEARHTDEEAFGEDLKREERKAEKAKRRQQKEEFGWDDNGNW